MTTSPLRFKIIAYGEAEISAKRKTTGKWEIIGSCHSASVPILKASLERFAELVKITVKL